jgi:DNA-binding PadR family transcriptional regulator
MAPPQRIPTGSWAVLALLSERDTHGWTLVRAMEPNGEIGRVWAMKRALVYRTVGLHVATGLVERVGPEPASRGPARTLLRATPAGRADVARWLSEPDRHVRDLRSSLLLKLLFARRSQLDTGPLLDAQHAILLDTVAALSDRVSHETGPDLTTVSFRLETARAGLRFVEGERARLQLDRSRAALAPHVEHQSWPTECRPC